MFICICYSDMCICICYSDMYIRIQNIVISHSVYLERKVMTEIMMVKLMIKIRFVRVMFLC